MTIILCLESESPDKSNYQLRIDKVTLSISDFYLLGLFNFQPRSGFLRPNQFAARKNWYSLLMLCTSLCIVFSILSLFGRKISTRNISSPAVLLGGVKYLVKTYFVGYCTFEGVVTTVVLPRTNKKMYQRWRDVTLQELKILTTTKKKQDPL